jgi:peptidoglycan/LPS O-acetylase OafA/YrhL
MNYIKHLDGLRALAVILVILFHSGIEIFSGGYIGVDIFFVLSGYLITGIIIKKLKNNSFSFNEFYAKRIKRLIPPVTIVTIFSLIVGYYAMSPYQFFTLIDQAFYSTILLSNFYLSKNSDYFSLSTFENPLMHTWSLSLEEQFYLIFPILFIILYYKFKNRIVLILSIFLLISLLMAQFGGNLTFEKPFIEDKLFFFNQPGFASYFMPIGRFFEFLLGSVAYLLSPKLKKFQFN